MIKSGEELRILQPLRGDVDELRKAVFDLICRLTGFSLGVRRVKLFDGDLGLLGLILLILHKRDERADHDNRLGKKERGQLIRQGFPRPSGHNGENVASLKNGFQNISLAGTKTRDAEADLGFVKDLGPRNVRG